ncbi:peptide deformylase [Sphingobacterium sp. C459-1T]|uniref:Peptide deformylase n=2 Tax=Sphingobacterium faecale TaxID=2803775 RepID=A0ABS1R6F9_9SPHI|nr:peptide deformylase [Sphingobacterium faecale]
MTAKTIHTILWCLALTTSAAPSFSQEPAASTMKNNQMGKSKTSGFNKLEKDIILGGQSDSELPVYLITDKKELKVLKKSSIDIDYAVPLLPVLEERMLKTVQNPSHPGVGIAAPQVGINRNLIWVQRFDKEGEPFEFYINPKIIWKSKLTRQGIEGCLSIPDRKEDVLRSYAIRITYQDKKGQIVEENIEGFTAVIFQHEVDHLYGILYPDRLVEQEDSEQVELNEKIPFSIPKNTLIP